MTRADEHAKATAATERITVGTRVRALYPNESWGEGVVEVADPERLAARPAEKPFIVLSDDGRRGHFHADQIEAVAPKTYEVAYLQAVEPDELPRDQGVDVFVHADLDSMGFNTVTLSAPDRDQLVEYVRAQFGDDDAEWFDEYVVQRVTEHQS